MTERTETTREFEKLIESEEYLLKLNNNSCIFIVKIICTNCKLFQEKYHNFFLKYLHIIVYYQDLQR